MALGEIEMDNPTPQLLDVLALRPLALLVHTYCFGFWLCSPTKLTGTRAVALLLTLCAVQPDAAMEGLVLSARHTEIITDLLRRNTSLASLSFAHSSLPQGLLPTVVELLLDHPNVQHFRELNLEGVGLGDDGTQRCSVRVVIACSPLHRSFGNAPDMDDLCELIEEHRSLDSLNLSHNVALTDEGVDWLVQAVGGDGAHTRSLDTIHLAGCPLVSESARERVDHAIHSALRILKTPDQGNHSSHNMLRAVPVVPVKRKSL